MDLFQKIKIVLPKRTQFHLSNEVKGTTDFGILTPTLIMDLLPGDRGKISNETYWRLHPLLAPLMHRCNVYVHNFYIDCNILWEDYYEFHTGGKDGNSRPIVPTIRVNFGHLYDNGVIFDDAEFKELFGVGSLWDYLGFPTIDVKDIDKQQEAANEYTDIPLMPFLAFYKVWQYYYADENLSNMELDYDYKLPSGIIDCTDSGNGGTGDVVLFEEWKFLFKLRYRAWAKDYFTSALPFPQRGADIDIPLSGEVPINGQIRYNRVNSDGTGFGRTLLHEYGRPGSELVDPQGFDRNLLYSKNKSVQIGASTEPPLSAKDVNIDVTQNLDISELRADLSQGNLVTINELRRLYQTQRFEEKMARGGFRPYEYFRNIWGVRNSDARLQMPKYLGGGRAPVVIGEVLQTSQSVTDGSNPSSLGDMAGRGVSSATSRGVRFFSEQHGFLLSISSVIPKAGYQQGWPRMYDRWEREDYAIPDFANLGEQELKSKEVYWKPGSRRADNETFGYQSRYAEYKYLPSTVHGDFRTNLAFWHLGRIFNDRPGLNEDFVTVKPKDTNRIWAVETANGARLDHLMYQVLNDIKIIRPLPKYGTPRL